MHPTEPPYFPPRLPAPDRPLSIQGRFRRLSFIAWFAFIQFIFLCSTIALGLSIDIVNFSGFSVDPGGLLSLQGLSSLGTLIILLLYLYFALVIMVRRLHDLERSGWWLLLFLLPVMNLLLWLYLLFAAGTRGTNQYGPVRPNQIWEKIVAWLVIGLSILSLLTILSLWSSLDFSTPSQLPGEVRQKTTGFF